MLKKLLTKTVKTLDMPKTLVPGIVMMHTLGNKEILIENHYGIVELNENEMEISGGSMTIKIFGEKLSIERMSLAETVVKGKILGIEFRC